MNSHENEISEVLAKLFATPEEARAFLETTGFPSGHVPCFNTPWQFWVSVVSKVSKGLPPGRAQVFVAGALDLFPHNADLKALKSSMHTGQDHIERSHRQTASHPQHLAKASTFTFIAERNASGQIYAYVGLDKGAALAIALAALVAGFLSVAVYMKSEEQAPRKVQPRAILGTNPTDTSADDDGIEIELLDEDVAAEPSPTPSIAPRKSSGNRRAGRRSAGKAAESPTQEPTFVHRTYRTYNCLVGPDEPEGSVATNKKGECSESDRRAFLTPPWASSQR